MAFERATKIEEIPPGQIREITVSGKPVAVANVDGKLFAINSVCLHHGGPLGDGELEGTVVSCPWHGWQYDVRSGENEFDLAIRLRTYDVQVEDGEIRVSV